MTFLVTPLRKKDRRVAVLATAILNEFAGRSCEFRYAVLVKTFIDLECDLLAGDRRNGWGAFPRALEWCDMPFPDTPFARALQQQISQL